MSDLFQPRQTSDIGKLIAANPLVWIVSHTPAGLRGTTLPVMAHLNDAGSVTGVEGHFARSNSHLTALRDDPRALILVLGPHGYISPSWVRDGTWAPTWNFAHAQFQVTLDFFEAPEAIEAHLRKLVDTMERGRADAWSVDEMGPRYARLSRGIVGFNAKVIAADQRFKLGQDERPEIFEDICGALGDVPLAALMRQQNQPK